MSKATPTTRPRRQGAATASRAPAPAPPAAPASAAAARRDLPTPEERLYRARRLGHRPASPLPAPAGSVQPYRVKSKGWKESEDRGIYLHGKKDLLAQKSLIEASNQQLAVAGRYGSLVALAPGDAQEVGSRRYHQVVPTLNQESFKRLLEAEPHSFHKGLKQEPETPLKIWADCRRASEAVTGSSTSVIQQDRRVPVREGDETVLRGGSTASLPYNVAKLTSDTHTGRLSWQVYQSNLEPFVAGRELKEIFSSKALKRNFPGIKTWETVKKHVAASRDDVFTAWKAYDSLTPEAQQAFAVFSGIDLSALPEVGESFAIVTEYDMPGFQYKQKEGVEQVPWAFHWGGVVLADADDRVTLENYSVSDEGLANTEWNFDLYGTRTPEQTFHHRHLEGTVLHGTKATTLRVITEGTPRNVQEFVGEIGEVERQVGNEEGFRAAWKAAERTRKALAEWYEKLSEPLPEQQQQALTWAMSRRGAAATRHRRTLELDALYQRSLKHFEALPKGKRRSEASALGKAAATERSRLEPAFRESDDLDTLETAIRKAEEAVVGARLEASVDAMATALGGDGFGEAGETLKQVWGELESGERELKTAVQAIERAKALVAANRGIAAFGEAVDQLAEAIASDEFGELKKQVLRAHGKVESEYREVAPFAKAVERARQAVETHERVMVLVDTLAERVERLAGGVGTGGYEAAKGAVASAYQDIGSEYRERPRVAEAVRRAKELVRVQGRITTFVDLVAELDEVVGTAGFESAKKALAAAYGDVDGGFRGRPLATGAVERAKTLVQVQGHVVAFVGTVDELDDAVGTSGFDAKKNAVVEAFQDVETVYDKRETAAAALVRAKQLASAHHKVLTLVDTVETMAKAKGTGEFESAKKAVSEAYQEVPEPYRKRELAAAAVEKARSLV